MSVLKEKEQAARKRSVRLETEKDIELPETIQFLVYFTLDGKFDLLKSDHSSWPKMSNQDKLSLHWTDINFKQISPTGAKKIYVGTVIMNGPVGILRRVGDKMNALLVQGVKPRDMNISLLFEQARSDIENENEGICSPVNKTVRRKPSRNFLSESEEDDDDDNNNDHNNVADIPDFSQKPTSSNSCTSQKPANSEIAFPISAEKIVSFQI